MCVKLGAVAAFILVLAGCSNFSAKVPLGFAAYEGQRTFRAVSPEGVLFRVKQVKHRPRAELSYWKEAVEKRMLDAGYLLVSRDSIQLDGVPGALLELTAPVKLEDHIYLIAIFPTEKHLLVIEASGEVTEFRNRKEAILSAIRGIDYQP